MDLLVVDPDVSIRMMFFAAADQLGCDLAFAESGQEALQCLQETPGIGIVLIALNLPDAHARSLSRQIRDTFTDRPLSLVFLSDTEDPKILVPLLDFGDDFVTKPFSQQILLAKLVAHQRIRGLHQHIANHNKELEFFRNAVESEHMIASDVFSRFTEQNLDHVAGLDTFISPHSTFNGDILLTARHPSGGLVLMVADITGHGLPAALGTLPIAEIFFAMSSKGFSPGAIAREMNSTFRQRMPDYILCAASIMQVSADASRMDVWLGGMPDMLVIDHEGNITDNLKSQHMALGALPDRRFNTKTLSIKLEKHHRILCYTDGVIETNDDQGQLFGTERLLDTLRSASSTGTGTLTQYIIQSLYQFSAGTKLNDDTTLVCLDIDEYRSNRLQPVSPQLAPDDFPADSEWSCTVTLCARMLRNVGALDQIFEIMPDNGWTRACRAELHLIINEMFVNALDHGLLKLDSRLKEACSDIGSYFTERENRLANLESGQIVFFIRCHTTGVARYEITCEDSGEGFDTRQHKKPGEVSGRGLMLLNSLCSDLRHNEKGNRVTATYVWPT